MATESLQEQVDKYLADAHSIETQALAQMRAAPGMTEDPELRTAFAQHLGETEEHERLVAQRLEQAGASPSRVKDAAGAVSGKGFVMFARAQPDTPGKLVAHAFSYEHMELAAYELLGRAAERAGDEQTVALAARIGADEEAMGARLAALFDRAADEALGAAGGPELDSKLASYLADAHAIEGQAVALLTRSRGIAGDPALARAFEDHLTESESHERIVAERLRALGSSPSLVKDAALRLGALNWGAFFGAQPDTPAKLAGFAYAFEHLEIASYELLGRVAARAGDAETRALASQILEQERAAAARVHGLLGDAMDTTLELRGLVGSPR
jgi:ferritin-like metal-binding protein YciE